MTVTLKFEVDTHGVAALEQDIIDEMATRMMVQPTFFINDVSLGYSYPVDISLCDIFVESPDESIATNFRE